MTPRCDDNVCLGVARGMNGCEDEEDDDALFGDDNSASNAAFFDSRSMIYKILLDQRITWLGMGSTYLLLQPDHTCPLLLQ